MRSEVGDAPLGVLASAAAELADDEGLAAALAALPDDQRTVVVLRHVLELTPGEIAAELGVPRGTVNSRLRRGLDALEPWARSAR
jgi:RNA polymerase sigma-70 factor, ECF subfamily